MNTSSLKVARDKTLVRSLVSIVTSINHGVTKATPVGRRDSVGH